MFGLALNNRNGFLIIKNKFGFLQLKVESKAVILLLLALGSGPLRNSVKP